MTKLQRRLTDQQPTDPQRPFFSFVVALADQLPERCL
jgi:hypothetical protein